MSYDDDDELKPCWCAPCWGCCYGCTKCFSGGGWKGCTVVGAILLICLFPIWGILIVMAALFAIMGLALTGCCGCFCCCQMFKGSFWGKFFINCLCCYTKNPNKNCICCGCNEKEKEINV